MTTGSEDKGEFLRHISCNNCGSSDANALYSNGTSYCFGCEKWEKVDGEYTPSNTAPKDKTLLKYEYQALAKRKIPDAIVAQYRYGVGHDKNGTLCQIANYFNKDKELIAQKLRYADKTFKFIGDSQNALMFGQQLWSNTGKKVIVTEGEIDALSVATAFDGKYPVVSIKGGSNSAKKEIAKHLEWLLGYEEIYLWFDSDDAGRKAVAECTHILPADKVRIIRHADYKDANEVLTYKGKAGILNAFYNAEKYKPDSILTFADIREAMKKPKEVGFPYYSERLTKLLYGRRFGEVIVVGAGVSIGKTDFIMSQIAFDLQQEWSVGTFMLEQTAVETGQRVTGKIDGCIYHNEAIEANLEQMDATAEKYMTNRLFLFSDFGSNDWATIKTNIKYMYHNYSTKIFYIDNLTALNSHAQDERRNLDALMAEIAGLAKELNIWIMLVSHLNPPKSGPSHECGGRTEQAQFTGSRAIMRWATTMYGIERNTLHEDVTERNKGLIRILKDRYSGTATGNTVGFRYDSETSLVHELDEDFEIEQTGGDGGSDF
jgi:twinkle protein